MTFGETRPSVARGTGSCAELCNARKTSKTAKTRRTSEINNLSVCSTPSFFNSPRLHHSTKATARSGCYAA